MSYFYNGMGDTTPTTTETGLTKVIKESSVLSIVVAGFALSAGIFAFSALTKAVEWGADKIREY